MMDNKFKGSDLKFEVGSLEFCLNKQDEFKESFILQKSWLEDSYYKGRPIKELMTARLEMMDKLIKDLFLYFAGPMGTKNAQGLQSISLVAIGGYGRCQLFPFSDIDLLFLCHGKPEPTFKTLIEKILYFLWDLGLEIGYSVRTISETLNLARRDFSILTALLSSRFLCGEISLYEELNQAVEKKLVPKTRKALFRFLVADLNRRHKEYGSSPYLLEPNIKEGMGGLRDIQTIRWLLKIFHGTDDLESLESFGAFTENELLNLIKGEEFFSKIRHELHYINGRRSECLSFESQQKIARQLGNDTAVAAQAVEKLMQRFYFYAGNIKNVVKDLIEKIEEMTQFNRKIWNLLGIKKRESILGILVSKENIPTENVFLERPVLAIEAFSIAQKRNLPLGSALRDRLKQFTSRIQTRSDTKQGPAFLINQEMYANFGKLFELEGNLAETLESMHTIGLLGKFIPEFEAIAHLTHHDLYHIYPVDVHSIMAIRELVLLRQGEYQNELPLLTGLVKEIKELNVLMLAALLHDIGKALPGDHSETGANLAKEIGLRLTMPGDQVEKLSFLIKQHLYLNEISQRRDLNDERIIVQVAQRIGDIDLLKMLLLLTFADIKAVGTEAWTEWKNMLLSELFFKVLHVLERGEFSTANAREIIVQRQKELRIILSAGMDSACLEEYLKSLPPGYLLNNEASTIATHIRLAQTLGEGTFVYSLQEKALSGYKYSQFTLCTPDSHALFSKISGVMAYHDMNILEAKINTWTNGLALDVFSVNSVLKEENISQERWTRFLTDLSHVLTGGMSVNALIARKKTPTILKEKIVPTYPAIVKFDNDFSEFYTLIEVHGTDRLGLLYAVTSVLSQKGCYIYKAKVTTKANEVIDTFYVQDIFGQKILEEVKLNEIKQALLIAVEPKG